MRKAKQPVYQFDLDGKLIASFNSIKEGIEATGVNIYNALSRNPLAGGYLWSQEPVAPAWTPKNSLRPLYQFDREGNFIAKYFGRTAALKATGIDCIAVVYEDAKTAGGYLWSFSEIPPDATRKKREVQAITVFQFGLDGQFIRTFNSVHEVKEITGVSCHNALNGTSKTSGGYLWSYSQTPPALPVKKEVAKPIKQRVVFNRTVYQFDLDGRLVSSYPSVRDAKKATGIECHSVLYGYAKTAGGFQWSYNDTALPVIRKNRAKETRSRKASDRVKRVKRIKNRRYWTHEQEELVISYLTADQVSRDLIYLKLRPPLIEIIKGILGHHFYGFIGKIDYNEILSMAEEHVYSSVLLKFDPSRGTRAYSFIGTCVKHFLMDKFRVMTTEIKTTPLFNDKGELVNDIGFEDDSLNEEDMNELRAKALKQIDKLIKFAVGEQTLMVLNALYKLVKEERTYCKYYSTYYLMKHTGLSQTQVKNHVGRFGLTPVIAVKKISIPPVIETLSNEEIKQYFLERYPKVKESFSVQEKKKYRKNKVAQEVEKELSGLYLSGQ